MNLKFNLFKSTDNEKTVVKISYKAELVAVMNHDENRNGGINIHIPTRYVKRENLSELKFHLDDFVKALEQARLLLLDSSDNS
jgi:hypothetical protein